MTVSASVQRERDRLGLPRSATAVCIPLTTRPELFYQCVRSVLEHTPEDAPILVAGDEEADPAVERFLSELGREVHYIRLSGSPGPVALASALLTACAEANAVLLASHALVFEGWLERMREAGRSDSAVGTASALGNNAGLLSIPGPYEPLPQDRALERLAAEVTRRSPQARPLTPTADGHCIWIARAALQLAGPLDPAFASLRASLIDFAQRCLLHGLVSVTADDVYVPSVMPGLSAHGGPLDVAGDRVLLERRYPYLRPALSEAAWPALSRSLSAARRALRKLSVTIDARILRGSFSGAHAETLELIETLGRIPELSVRVLLDPAVGSEAFALLDGMPGVERLSAGDTPPEIDRTDVVHRPYQVTSIEDLELLARLGERLVITHLDLIAFHNPGYFGSFEGWHQHRRITRQALAMADQVIFLSKHAAQDAIREGLLEHDRVHVMPMGLNRRWTEQAQCQPAGAPECPFLLCIGNDFRHKNRLFAIKLLSELHELGWEGHLVLVGANVGHGSSRGEEAAYLASRPELATLVRELPAVDEAEKAWLYASAAAVVYPTVYEGFGLIPFEAVRAGTPCLFAPQTSLAEVLPAETAVLVPWDARESAERALPLLRDTKQRRRHIDLISDRAKRMADWDLFGGALLEIYEEATRLPLREAALLAADGREREAELARWVGLKESMGEVVGPNAPLPVDAQRGLIALATRKRLRRPLFTLLGGLYRFGYRARRRK